MEQLKAKLKKQGGFTMVEMLIVVAIIAILIAVSIPMFNNALEGSRHAVDQANNRDAIALATVEYMTAMDKSKFDGAGQTYHYVVDETAGSSHNHQGRLSDSGGITPKCTCTANASTAIGALTVTVKSPGTGDNGLPQITTSWQFNATSGATEKATT